MCRVTLSILWNYRGPRHMFLAEQNFLMSSRKTLSSTIILRMHGVGFCVNIAGFYWTPFPWWYFWMQIGSFCTRLHDVWQLQVSEKFLTSVCVICLFSSYFCDVNNSTLFAREHTEFKIVQICCHSLLCYTHWTLSHCITVIFQCLGDNFCSIQNITWVKTGLQICDAYSESASSMRKGALSCCTEHKQQHISLFTHYCLHSRQIWRT